MFLFLKQQYLPTVLSNSSDPEQRSAPSSVTLSTLGKLENNKMKSIFTLFPFDCLAFHPRFSKEQRIPEHCMFEPSQTVILVTGEENLISIFQDETVFGNVTFSDPAALVDQVSVIAKVDSQEPRPSPEPVRKKEKCKPNCIYHWKSRPPVWVQQL